MCLYIKNRHKIPFVRKWKAKKLHRDLVVYKNLGTNPRVGLNTPYQNMKIAFNPDGLFISEPYYKEEFEELGVWDNKIGYPEKTAYGYHAFLNLDAAAGHMFSMYNEHISTYKAVIPKGAYVFYGENSDICASQIIITDKVMQIKRDKWTVTKL